MVSRWNYARKRGKPPGTLSCVICRAALARGEGRRGRRCNLCLVVMERMAFIHGTDHMTEVLGPSCRAYRAAREAEQAERIAREMAAR